VISKLWAAEKGLLTLLSYIYFNKYLPLHPKAFFVFFFYVTQLLLIFLNESIGLFAMNKNGSQKLSSSDATS
jgi:hypothetical protein